MTISIIIPTYNEADQITEVIETIRKHAVPGHLCDIIVVDGGSQDKTAELAYKAGAHTIISANKGRAAQMNVGAKIAQGKILYFLHGDTFPPPNFSTHILSAFKRGYQWGCFRLQFDCSHWVLITWGWISRFPFASTRFGDQSLFVGHELFSQIQGFREDYKVMEDHEIVMRLKKKGKLKVIQAPVISSAKKFQKNGTLRLFCCFILIYCLYKLNFSQDFLIASYRKLIKEGKI